jgi:hypothetical protein
VSNALKAYITLVVAASAIALAATTLLIPVDSRISPIPGATDVTAGVVAGVALWTVITILFSALPVTLPNGSSIAVATAPIVVAMTLGGPTAAGWVALIGVTEIRELRGRIPWYGTLVNHAGIVLPAIAGGVLVVGLRGVLGENPGGVLEDFVGSIVGATVYLGLNVVLVGVLRSLRTGRPLAVFLSGGLYTDMLTLGPLAWLMAQMYVVAWWASLLFAIPLYTTRTAYHRYVLMREMFTQTIGALAEAVDARDPFTSAHSRRVMEMSVDSGRVLKVSDSELEALEWGGLLHDIGKIGVRDAVLLKEGKLTREERVEMNAHPVKGANIIAPVTLLARTVPLIRHHHEWYNGSGYPDRLVGVEIPWLARILHVADAFEAMTAQRPYRMVPLTPEQALAELRKFAGIQFDPRVVDAFARTKWAEGIADPGRPLARHPVPLLSQAAGRIARHGTDGGGGSASAADALAGAEPGAATVDTL